MASTLEHEKPIADVEEQPSAKKIKVDDDNVSVESAEEDKTNESTKDSAEESAEDQADDSAEDEKDKDKEDGDDNDDSGSDKQSAESTKPASSGFGGFSGFSGFSGFASFKQTGATGFGGFATKASDSGSGFTFTAGTSDFSKPAESKTEPAASVTALTEAELANGEEDEQLVVERRGKLFKFVEKDFSEVGIGPFRLLKAKDASGDDAAKASARIVMRRESYPRGPGTKLILNARLTACVSCVKKTEKSLMLVIVEPADDGKLKPVTYLFRFGSPEDLAAVRNSILSLLPAHATTEAATESSASS
ncbi:hypothetical protein ATCC90586_010362 [Pythium insidiosum]|nr:hypothetical protein ATCC90586_010362 [Pythium insidiosum]